MADLTGRTIAFLVAPEGIEQVELTRPLGGRRGTPAARRSVLSLESGTVQAYHHLDKADTFAVDAVVGDAEPRVVRRRSSCRGPAWPTRTPCGWTRTPSRFVRPTSWSRTVRSAAICHAPWTLAEADVVRGRRMTSWPSLQTDLRNARGPRG